MTTSEILTRLKMQKRCTVLTLLNSVYVGHILLYIHS